jgi:GntR family transcriptional regulator
LPTEAEFEAIFGVSRTTVRGALAQLHRAGRLERKQGRGTFWTAKAIAGKQEKLAGINRQIFHITRAATVEVLARFAVRAPEEIGRFLGLPPESRVLVFKQVRSCDSEPFSFTINYLPWIYGRAIQKKHLERMTMLETLERIVKIELGAVEHEVEITRATTEIAERLRIHVLDPVLTVNTKVFDGRNKPVEIVWTYFVESKYKFRVVLDKEQEPSPAHGV